MSRRNDVDWTAVRVDYEAGLLSMRTIGKKYGVTHQGIKKRAIRESWTIDLLSRIRVRAKGNVGNLSLETLVANSKVSTSVSTEMGHPDMARSNHSVEVKNKLQAHISQEWIATFTRAMQLVRELVVLERMLHEIHGRDDAAAMDTAGTETLPPSCPELAREMPILKNAS